MTAALHVVNSVFDAWNAKDIDAIAALVGDVVVLDGPLERSKASRPI